VRPALTLDEGSSLSRPEAGPRDREPACRPTSPPVRRWPARSAAGMATMRRGGGLRLGGERVLSLGILPLTRWEHPCHGPGSGTDAGPPGALVFLSTRHLTANTHSSRVSAATDPQLTISPDLSCA
jgi:hypothetical protein